MAVDLEPEDPAVLQDPGGLVEVAQDRAPDRDVLEDDVGVDEVERSVRHAGEVPVGTLEKGVVAAGERRTAPEDHLSRDVYADRRCDALGHRAQEPADPEPISRAAAEASSSRLRTM